MEVRRLITLGVCGCRGGEGEVTASSCDDVDNLIWMLVTWLCLLLEIHPAEHSLFVHISVFMVTFILKLIYNKKSIISTSAIMV